MKQECQKQIDAITTGFHTCRTAFTAIGDETRQDILLPVSYTHLDVYKRQDMSGTSFAFLAKDKGSCRIGIASKSPLCMVCLWKVKESVVKP